MVGVGLAGVAYAALEVPRGIGYAALLTVAALGLASVGAFEVAEPWTSPRHHRHRLLGSACLFGGVGGLALIDAIRTDETGKAILFGVITLILLPFAGVSLLGWIRLGRERKSRAGPQQSGG